MIRTEGATLPTSTYKCEIKLREPGRLSTTLLPLLGKATTVLMFILVSWGIGTLVLIGQGVCTSCLSPRHILISVCGGAVIVLTTGAVCTCCAVCSISLVQIATPAEEV